MSLAGCSLPGLLQPAWKHGPVSAGVIDVFQDGTGTSVRPHEEEPHMALELPSYPEVHLAGRLPSIAKSPPHLSTTNPLSVSQASLDEVHHTSNRRDNVTPTSAWRHF